MAKRDLSRTFQEMESEDLSLETTVPTDLSLTLSVDELSDHTHTHNRRRTQNKYLIERKQLAHDLQVVKIELSQKCLMIDNLKADHMQKVDDLEEKLSDALHQKNLLQAKLESQLKIEQEEARRQQHQIQQELSAILKRQQQLERTNERLQEKAIDIRRSLQDLELSEGRYHQLKAHNEAELTLKDIVAVKLFEAVLPWKQENRELKTRVRSLGEELHKCCTELQNCKDALEEEKRVHAQLQIQHQKLALAHADVKSQVQNDNYKIENYDRVKRHQDDLERDLADLNKQHGYLVAAHEAAISERDCIKAELSASKQTAVLLQQDKEFFSKQATELQNRLLHSDDRLTQVTENLERTKQAREELYDKYVTSSFAENLLNITANAKVFRLI
ncbi:Progesterone-induced-blocking factor 1 [Lamellibrachia satsuma]|nr:Progesterone-induced-blocking factor 1 [Lamellibrachia satsuma]